MLIWRILKTTSNNWQNKTINIFFKFIIFTYIAFWHEVLITFLTISWRKLYKLNTKLTLHLIQYLILEMELWLKSIEKSFPTEILNHSIVRSYNIAANWIEVILWWLCEIMDRLEWNFAHDLWSLKTYIYKISRNYTHI